MAGDEADGSAFSSLSDLEAAAARRVGPSEWAYVQGGAEEERALRANRRAFEVRTLLPRLLADVSALDPTTSLLGSPVRFPFFVSPTAHHEFLHPDAEAATARASASAGVLACFSTLSARSLEEIAEAGRGGPRWFQLYLQPEFDRSRALVERAERSGYSALVLTADMPVLGPRDGLADARFDIYARAALGNGPGIVPPDRAPLPRGTGFSLGPPAAATWGILEEIRGITRLPVVVKGILTPEDAERALRLGARGIFVSNHGGRQLDAAPATLDVLGPIARAVGDRAEVYLDGGVRRGTDVLVSLASGARAVGLGRPVLWALGAGGQPGVERDFSQLGTEVASAMALLGCARMADVDGRCLGPLRRGFDPATCRGPAP